MTEQEALALMALPKFGEPEDEWQQRKNRPGLIVNQFGILDSDGAAIRGMQVEFQVYRMQRVAAEKITLTLFRSELRAGMLRVFQMELNTGRRLREDDHAFPHEHVGNARFRATPDWSTLDLDLAVARFCRRCNLTLRAPLPAVDAFPLR